MDKVITLLRFIFHISVFFLIVISLYPGCLVGYFLFGDMGRHPNLLNSSLGTSVNHFIYDDVVIEQFSGFFEANKQLLMDDKDSYI